MFTTKKQQEQIDFINRLPIPEKHIEEFLKKLAEEQEVRERMKKNREDDEKECK